MIKHIFMFKNNNILPFDIAQLKQLTDLLEKPMQRKQMSIINCIF